MTFAENEERSPWEPFHVQHGMAAGDSAVSVFIGCRATAFTLGRRETHEEGRYQLIQKYIYPRATFGDEPWATKLRAAADELIPMFRREDIHVV